MHNFHYTVVINIMLWPSLTTRGTWSQTYDSITYRITNQKIMMG